MTGRWPLFLPVLVATLAMTAGIRGALATSADDDDHDAEASSLSTVVVIDGRPAVRLDEDARERAGIVTQALAAATVAPEIAAVGTVVDIQPLLALRDRYRQGLHQAEAAGIRLEAARVEYERLLALYEDDANVAMKAVQQAETAWRSHESERNRLWAALGAIGDQADAAWGPELRRAALDDEAGLEPFVGRRDALLLATLPVGARLGDARDARAMRAGASGSVAARYVAPAVATAGPGGETHYYRVPAAGLRTGMRLSVTIPEPGAARTGVIVPRSAIVWALGRAWIYAQLDDAHFGRREVAADNPTDAGWFVDTDLRPGDRVVTAGAQILYAEEFRWQVRDEDDD